MGRGRYFGCVSRRAEPRTRGGTYDYFDVPAAVVREFVSAPSLGRFVNWRIKPRYRYVRIG